MPSLNDHLLRLERPLEFEDFGDERPVIRLIDRRDDGLMAWRLALERVGDWLVTSAEGLPAKEVLGQVGRFDWGLATWLACSWTDVRVLMGADLDRYFATGNVGWWPVPKNATPEKILINTMILSRNIQAVYELEWLDTSLAVRQRLALDLLAYPYRSAASEFPKLESWVYGLKGGTKYQEVERWVLEAPVSAREKWTEMINLMSIQVLWQLEEDMNGSFLRKIPGSPITDAEVLERARALRKYMKKKEKVR